MSFSKKASYSSGEVDPSLHDVTDIKAYYSGLKTAKNITVGKNGRLLNDAGSWFYNRTEIENNNNEVYIPSFFKEGTIPYALEFGVGYVKLHPLTHIKDQNYKRPVEPFSAMTNKVWIAQSASYNFTFRTGKAPYTMDKLSGGGTVLGTTFTAPASNDTTLLQVTDANGDFFDITVYTKTSGPTVALPYGYLIPTSYTEDDLSELTFETVKHADNVIWVYVARKGKVLEAFTFDGVSILRYGLGTDTELASYGVYQDYPQVTPYNMLTPVIEYAVANGPMMGRVGTPVQYGVTFITRSGLESPVTLIESYKSSDNVTSTWIKLPTGTELTGFYVKNITSMIPKYSEDIAALRIYRRPIMGSGGSSLSLGWGLIGESVITTGTGVINASNLTFGFTDFGQEADFSNSPPRLFPNLPAILNPLNYFFYSCAGVATYQNRLVLWDENYLFASRVNQPTYFLEDFPQTEATAFNIKIGTQGDIYNFIEHNGMIVFSSEGIFYGGYDSPVSGVNPIIAKRGRLIIDQSVKPILTPYGVFFVDRSTNAIRTLEYDDNSKSMVAEDVSLFNDHLFYLRKVKDWLFKEGENSHLEVLMSDGKLVKLTYNKTERINAWTRHETDGFITSMSSYFDIPTGESHMVYLVNRKNGPLSENSLQTIELSSRRIKKDDNTLRAFSSASTEFITEQSVVPLVLALNIAPGGTDWSDTLIYESMFIGMAYVDAIGKTFIAFTPDGKDRVYLTITDAVAGDYVEVEPSKALPVSLQPIMGLPNPFDIYECHTTVEGLEHLEGRYVSVVCDGAVISSPLNDHDSAEPPYRLQVGGGGILELPIPSYQTIVGLPYVSDIETLALDMREGGGLLNKKLTNKIHVNYSRTRGSYVSGKFAENDGVKGMEFGDIWNRNNTVNQPLIEKDLRVSYSIYSDYELNGKIAIRQVDPVPMEVNSIILDVMSE